MIQIKDQWISLDGIRLIEFSEAYKHENNRCHMVITYSFDVSNKTYISLSEVDAYEEYIHLAEKIANAVNNK